MSSIPQQIRENMALFDQMNIATIADDLNHPEDTLKQEVRKMHDMDLCEATGKVSWVPEEAV